MTYTPNDVITAETSGVYGYTELWSSIVGRDSMTFAVKACYDAHVVLATIPFETQFYTLEVVIGGWGNNKSAIRTEVGVRMK